MGIRKFPSGPVRKLTEDQALLRHAEEDAKKGFLSAEQTKKFFDKVLGRKKPEPEKIIYTDKEKELNREWTTLLMEMEAQYQITLSGAQKVAILLEKTIVQMRTK